MRHHGPGDRLDGERRGFQGGRGRADEVGEDLEVVTVKEAGPSGILGKWWDLVEGQVGGLRRPLLLLVGTVGECFVEGPTQRVAVVLELALLGRRFKDDGEPAR